MFSTSILTSSGSLHLMSEKTNRLRAGKLAVSQVLQRPPSFPLPPLPSAAAAAPSTEAAITPSWPPPPPSGGGGVHAPDADANATTGSWDGCDCDGDGNANADCDLQAVSCEDGAAGSQPQATPVSQGKAKVDTSSVQKGGNRGRGGKGRRGCLCY
jgi:hypothetical protein